MRRRERSPLKGQERIEGFMEDGEAILDMKRVVGEMSLKLRQKSTELQPGK